jgi:hypothetical protein
MNMYGGVDVKIHVFLTMALVGSEWAASRPGYFVLGERSSWDPFRRVGGPQTRSEQHGEEKIIYPTGT